MPCLLGTSALTPWTQTALLRMRPFQQSQQTCTRLTFSMRSSHALRAPRAVLIARSQLFSTRVSGHFGPGLSACHRTCTKAAEDSSIVVCYNFFQIHGPWLVPALFLCRCLILTARRAIPTVTSSCCYGNQLCRAQLQKVGFLGHIAWSVKHHEVQKVRGPSVNNCGRPEHLEIFVFSHAAIE